MTIKDFTNVPEIIQIFTDSAVTDCAQAVFYLEQYHFTTRTSIIEVMLEESEDPVLDVEKVEHVEELIGVEKRFNVMLQAVYGRQLMVYYPYFANVHREALELELNKYQLCYVAVTPYNFALLKDPTKSFEKWDADIVFKRLLMEAVSLKATDLHFSVQHVDLKPTYPVQYRKNGYLYDLDLLPIDAQMNQQIISKLIENKTNANSLDLNTPSGVTAVADDPLNNGKLELRISANRVEGGWHCVIRIQTKETFNFTIGQLGFSGDVQRALMKMTKKRSGIVFITGAIRTGKNTTAFAMANEMQNYPIKIVSYEFPIEVLMPFPQVNYKGDPEILLNSIRLAKKQDLNVAFINELPNKEVAFAVQDLVNSSVYVITTMHVDRIWHLPYKLKDYYGAEYKDIISQINATFNQKMFDVPCKECQDKKFVGDVEDTEQKRLLEKHEVTSYLESRGCSLCRDTKIQDGKNQPYVEYLIFTPELKSRLLACEQPYEMEQILKDEVMGKRTALEFSMTEAVRQGNLSIDSLDSIL